jgi:putative radical SAM enzyme (TIGR03279 family)
MAMALNLPVHTHEPNLTPQEIRRLPKNRVEAIDPDGAAAMGGVQIGDKLLTVNGEPIRDIVDWKFQTAGEVVELEFERDGQPYRVKLHKGYDENLGITFGDDLFDGIHICKNKCVFCFLYQQPKGLRPSLYIKDDDFRLSFLHGNYVTLTNLKPGELDRICEQKLSPIYVSIHATDPEARGAILGRKQAEPILPILERLADARIQIHGQVVLCPGYNDGAILEQTISELARLNPEARETYGGVLSVAVVPIGITQFRERLAPVQIVSPAYAAELLDWIEPIREKFRQTMGSRFVFFSDEFYLSAKREVPPKNHYEGFPQLEDGVGLVRLFLDELVRVERRLPASLPERRSFTLATGKGAAPILQRFADVMNRVENLSVNVLPIHNRFFEGNINIAGLIVGRDLIDAVNAFDACGDTVLIPNVMMRDGEEIFLDEMSLSEVNQEAKRPIIASPRTPLAAMELILSKAQ